MITRFGVRVLAAALLTLFGAMASAANLLFLLDGLLWAVLLVSWFAGRSNLRGVAVEASFPDQVFQGAPFELGLTLGKTSGRVSHQLGVAVPGAKAAVPSLRKGKAETVILPYTFPRRGRNCLADLRLESVFPFGIYRHRRKISPFPEGLAFPPVFELYGRRTSPSVREDQVSLPKRGVGDDFHGLREYGEGEDSRLINWKLTAKTGTPLVKEFAQQVGNRITITVADVAGPAAEGLISEAASLAKYFIDSGADVRLKTPEETIDFGHGLLHLQLILRSLALAGRGKEAAKSASPFPKPRFTAFPARERVPPLAYLATFIAFVSLFLIEELDPLVLLAFLPVFALAWAFDRFKKYPVPKPVLDVLSAAYLFFFLFVDLPAAGALQAVFHLVLFILLYLLISPKTGRVQQELFLAGFLAFALTSGQALSLWYFPVFLAYFAAAGAWLVRNQDPTAAPTKPRWAGSLAAAGGMAVAIAAVAFVLLPRPYSPRMQQLLASTGLTRFQTSMRSFAGLTERVELGFLGPIRKNSARVMRVSLGGTASETRPPFIHVRGTAFDVFDGRRWHKTRPEFDYRMDDRLIRARHARAWMRRQRGVVYAPFHDPAAPTRTEDIVISPLLNANLVFSVGPIAAIETTAPGAYFDFTDTVYLPSTYPEGIRYRVRSQGIGPRFHDAIQGYETILKTRYLTLQVPNERLKRLAEDITRNAAEPLAKAVALEAHFRGSFSYSLAAAHGRQDIDAFLFGSRAGNCEYFATAMVLLLRHLGVPARLAVGFLSDEWNAYGRFFDVRQSDAHTWVEAFFPDRGWVTFDPTPSDPNFRGRMGIFARVWTSVGQYFDALQYRWYRYVVGYDSFTQRNLFFHLRLRVAKSFLTILAVLVLAAALIALAVIWKPWRLWGARRARKRAGPENFFEEIVGRLGRAGLPRKPDETAAEYAAGVVRRFPDLGPLAALANYHYAVRFASRRLSPDQEARVRALMGRITDSLKRWGTH
jgi:uncharacterized protein (DUF58 family)/transglutaminase-like putative cysteine protease